MNGFDQVRDLIEYMVRGLVDQPAAITVDVIQQKDGLLYRLAVAPEDIDKVIGRRGCTAHSISVILSGVGAKVNRDVSLEITELTLIP
jgi:predicted RNA-binding protein YlqC (UPF0109 family)